MVKSPGFFIFAVEFVKCTEKMFRGNPLSAREHSHGLKALFATVALPAKKPVLFLFSFFLCLFV